MGNITSKPGLKFELFWVRGAGTCSNTRPSTSKQHTAGRPGVTALVLWAGSPAGYTSSSLYDCCFILPIRKPDFSEASQPTVVCIVVTTTPSVWLDDWVDYVMPLLCVTGESSCI